MRGEEEILREDKAKRGSYGTDIHVCVLYTCNIYVYPCVLYTCYICVSIFSTIRVCSFRGGRGPEEEGMGEWGNETGGNEKNQL